jgi:hypothetical protein
VGEEKMRFVGKMRAEACREWVATGAVALSLEGFLASLGMTV